MANRYPAIDLNLTCTAEEVQVGGGAHSYHTPARSFTLTHTLLQVGDNVQVDIVLQRDIEGADVTPVVTSYYPVPKEEVRFFNAAALFRALTLADLGLVGRYR